MHYLIRTKEINPILFEFKRWDNFYKSWFSADIYNFVIIENFPDFIIFDYLIIHFFTGGCCTSKNLISMSTETVRREGGQLGMHMPWSGDWGLTTAYVLYLVTQLIVLQIFILNLLHSPSIWIKWCNINKVCNLYLWCMSFKMLGFMFFLFWTTIYFTPRGRFCRIWWKEIMSV